MVRFPRDERDSVGYLDNMRIRTPDGGRVPFNAVAEVDIGESPTRIRRYDRNRAVQISAEVDKENYEPGKITADILQRELPEVLAGYPGVRHRLSGSSQSQGEVQADLVKEGFSHTLSGQGSGVIESFVNAMERFIGKKIVLVMSGGNLAVEKLTAILGN